MSTRKRGLGGGDYKWEWIDNDLSLDDVVESIPPRLLWLGFNKEGSPCRIVLSYLKGLDGKPQPSKVSCEVCRKDSLNNECWNEVSLNHIPDDFWAMLDKVLTERNEDV